MRREYDVTPSAYSPRLAARATITNLLAYSEAVTAANGWTLTEVTQTLNAANPETATVSAYSFLETVTNAAHSLGRAATTTAEQYTLSVFVKPTNRNFLRLQFTDSASAVFSGVFNIVDGQVFAQTNATASFIRVRDGYLRLMVTFTPAAGAGTALFSFSTNGSTFSYVGDVTKGAVLWGAQLGLGDATVGYLPNLGAATVRSVADADSANPFAWLVVETDPLNQTSALAKITRTFAQVPMTQSIPSSLMLTKPTLPLQVQDQSVGAYYVNRPNSAKESYDAYFAQDVTSDSGPPGLYPTGGTYTLSFNGDTTGALAFNAAHGTVETALNALTQITNFGGVTVSGTYNSINGLVVTRNAYAQATIASSLTSAGPTAAVMTYPDSNTSAQGGHQIIGGYNNTNAPITGGTFTVTVLGQTTAAIAWNASTTAVAAAINALSQVSQRGGVTVTFPYASGTAMAEPAGAHFGFTFDFTAPAITGNATSLTPSPAAISGFPDGNAGIWQLYFSIGASVRFLYVPGHGITTSDKIFILADGTYYGGISAFTIPNPDTIQLTITSGDAYAAAAAITQVGKRTKADYRPGTTGIRCLKNTLFYLPGITYGISSFSDIPLPTNQSDTATFLQAVFVGTGTLNWQVGEIMPWMGAILEQTTTVLNVADI